MRRLTPGNNTFTMPAAVIAPIICAMNTTAARVYVRQPTSVRARVTAGLKRPPLIRKNTHALTARLCPGQLRARTVEEEFLSVFFAMEEG